jgi:hypothetical protein
MVVWVVGEKILMPVGWSCGRWEKKTDALLASMVIKTIRFCKTNYFRKQYTVSFKPIFHFD